MSYSNIKRVLAAALAEFPCGTIVEVDSNFREINSWRFWHGKLETRK